MAHPDFEQSLIALMPNLYRFGLRLSRRPDLAEDLVQTTVERALAARDSLAPEMQLEPWVFRILRNAWIDLTRRARTRGTEIDIDDAPEAAIVDGPRVMEAALLLDATERALDSLSPDQREVLLLVCYQEMSYAETAEILGIPLWAAAAAASLALAVGLGGGLMLGGNPRMDRRPWRWPRRSTGCRLAK